MGENQSDNLNRRSSTNQDLERQKLEIEIELKKKELADFGKPPVAPRRAWWTVTVELLGVPVTVLGLVVAFTTASGNRTTQQKTVAEIAQIRANLAKADTSKLAADLSAKQKEGPKAFDQAVAQNADKIQLALERLQQLEQQAVQINIQRAVLKFVLLWILFNVMGLIFDVLSRAWNTALGTLFYGFNAWIQNRGRERENDQRSNLWRSRYERLAPGLFLVLNPLPDVLRWSIQLSIFVVLLAPLFNEIAASFGSRITFSDVLQQGQNLNVGAMLSMMKQILFGS
jgi:hypothetical protein